MGRTASGWPTTGGATALALLVRGELASVHYFPEDRDAGYVPVGNLAGLPAGEVTTFSISEHQADDVVVVSDAVVPVSLAAGHRPAAAGHRVDALLTAPASLGRRMADRPGWLAEPRHAADRRLIRDLCWLGGSGRGLLPGRLLSYLFGGGGRGWRRSSGRITRGLPNPAPGQPAPVLAGILPRGRSRPGQPGPRTAGGDFRHLRPLRLRPSEDRLRPSVPLGGIPAAQTLPVGPGHGLVLATELDRLTWWPESLMVINGGAVLPDTALLRRVEWSDQCVWRAGEPDFVLMNACEYGANPDKGPHFAVRLEPGEYTVQRGSYGWADDDAGADPVPLRTPQAGRTICCSRPRG